LIAQQKKPLKAQGRPSLGFPNNSEILIEQNMEPQQPQQPQPTASGADKRQTQSFLRNMFAQRGLHPKNKLGQNFLIDLNLIDLVLRSAELGRQDLVLEVGTGTGGLTANLARAAGSVLSVEIDRSFHDLARETIGDLDHVRLFRGDILENKNHLNPDVLALIQELTQTYQPQRLKLVANLPYAVATPVISNFLLTDLVFERMVVMVQWEIAERFVAVPSTKSYGSLAVLMQSLADVTILRKLSPTVFWPRPKVESAIVLIQPSAAKKAAIPHLMGFRVFLRELYSHRRKNLRGGLVSLCGRGSKPMVDQKLVELGIDGNVRAEALDVAMHHRLCEAFGTHDR